MLKTLFFVVIATVHCLEVKDKPNEDHVVHSHLPAQQGQRVDGFRPRSDWSYYYPSWSLSSISHFFKDDDHVEEPSVLLKRLAALEKRVKELNDLLKKQSSGSKKPESTVTPSKKVEATPCRELSPPINTPVDNKPETMNKLAESEKNTVTPEPVAEPTKPAENPEDPAMPQDPVKAAEATQDKNLPSKEPSPATK